MGARHIFDVNWLEQNVLLPVTGYESTDQYYDAANSKPKISSLRTPTLFFASEDDPFLAGLPDSQCTENPWTISAVTARGGHCAFLEGPYPHSSLINRVVVEYFEATLALHSQG